MPVSKERAKLYPGGSLRSKAWLAIRQAILDREGHQCKFCRLPNHSITEWTKGKPAKVVLTIAHLDHNPQHNQADNLAALCQRCHNRYDQPHRRINAEQTRHKALGMRDLFDD